MEKKPRDAGYKETERDEFLDAIGDRIKLARVRAKLTQKELATLLSTNQSWIYMVEDGQQNFQISSLRKIAKILKVSVRELIPDDSDPSPTYEIAPEVSETLHKLVSQMMNAILRALPHAAKPTTPLIEDSSKAKKSAR